jgi:cytochrome c peroxidase
VRLLFFIQLFVLPPIMSFAAIRAPLRRQALSASFKRAELRTSSFRKYSTEVPPAAKSNTGLYVGLGAVVLGGGVAYYLYDSSSETAKVTSTTLKSATQSAKVATNFVPTKEDYQKVRFNLCEGFLEFTCII